MNPRVPSTHTTHAGQVGKVGDREGWQIVPERFMGLGETGFEIWTFPNFLLSPGLPTRCCLYLEHPSPLSGAVIPGHPLGLSSDISSSDLTSSCFPRLAWVTCLCVPTVVWCPLCCP